MRSLRVFKRWPGNHPEINVVGLRGQEHKTHNFNWYWKVVAHKLLKEQPNAMNYAGINCKEDISFLETFDWSYLGALSTSQPNAFCSDIIYAYEKYKN